MNSLDLKLSSYHFDLPEELIAQRPEAKSRLLVYKVSTNEIFHDTFGNIASYLPPEALLVFNRSKVFPSRLLGTKESGGRAELFLLSTEHALGVYPALIKTRSKKKQGDTFFFPAGLQASIEVINSDGTFGVTFNAENIRSYLHEHAKIPIPPYIRNGESDEEDKRTYQTVYALEEGSVAAPTAGLHFKNDLLLALKNKNIHSAFVTLHVGLGTFKPVTVDNLRDHQMHSENFFFDDLNEQLIKKAREEKRKVFAVGTTTLRVLESSFEKHLRPNEMYSTNIFLHPGVDIKSVDGLITNFHLPKSTLLMLVSSLIGREKTLELYDIAIKERYRFFSYGDGMLIIR
ncbi:MAG: tRNA preQ1(34) S-adenosylmethionine ribosyltransferase-isomerase QueA [Bacteriovorax sp.]